MKKALMEFLGTFFLVLTIGLTVIAPNAGAFAPLAIGFILMVMVYAGGPVSGAHYNPAVTLACWLRGACGAGTVPVYLAAQLTAAACAGLMVNFFKDAAVTPMALQALPTLAAELLFTFALAFVVLSVATSKKSAGNSYFGLAIGSTVTAGAYATAGISGGVFNPAVAVGLAMMGLLGGAHLWLFFVANLLGGALAALAFKLVQEE